MKTMLGLFLLVGMSPGSLLPSFLTDRLLAPVQSLGGKANQESEGGNPTPDGNTSQPDQAELVALSYAATRSTGLQVAKDHIRAIFTLKIQPTAEFVPCVVMPVRADRSIRASLIESEIRIVRLPCKALPSLRAQAPPCLS